MRVLKLVLALVAVPFAVGVAQGNSNKCNPQQEAAAARARAAGRAIPPGLEKKDCGRQAPPPPAPQPPPSPQPPPPATPPSGPHMVSGMVYEDIDGNGSRDQFAGEMGLAGWTVELRWQGQVIASAVTDWDGSFLFSGLGNTVYEVCVVAQSGFARTQPVSGDGCGGAGYSSPFASTVPTGYEAKFGMMVQ